MEEQYINKIKKLWEDIHEKIDPVFYWRDNSETTYQYDPLTNSIVSDNGFSVSIEKDINEVTKEYIAVLIEKLETNIILYYRKNYNIELWYI